MAIKPVNQILLINAIATHLAKACRIRNVSQRQMNAIIQAATDICLAMSKPHQPAVPGMGLHAWLDCDDTGLSSLFMMSTLTQEHQPRQLHWPRDVADFGRCVGLLNAVPALRDRLHLMAFTCPQWQALVGQWAEMEELYALEKERGEFPRLSQLIQSLIQS
jgi:hypothetical protein